MMFRRLCSLPMVLLFLLPGAADSQVPPQAPMPCEDAEAKAFDFQIGSWRSQDGAQVHEVRRFGAGCSLIETWRKDGKDYALGIKSLDLGRHDRAQEKRWFYSWSGPGYHQLWTGKKENGLWRFYRMWWSEGKEVLSRTYWEPTKDGGLDRVVEQSRDGGKSFRPHVRDHFVRVLER